LQLHQRRLGLGDLVIELRPADLRQQLPCLHPIADIYVSLVHVAAHAGEEVRRRERRGRGRQRDQHIRIAGAHGRHANTRHEVAALL
jgi:hypothetical protein